MPLRNLLILLVLLCCRLSSPAATFTAYAVTNQEQRDQLSKPLYPGEMLFEENPQLQCCMKVQVTPQVTCINGQDWSQTQRTFIQVNGIKPLTVLRSEQLHRLLFPFHSFS